MTDWSYFKHVLNSESICGIPSDIEQLERQVTDITKKIQIAAWKSYPKVKRKTADKTYSKGLKTVVKQKRKTRKKWQQTRNPQTKTELNQITKKLSLEIKRNNNAG